MKIVVESSVLAREHKTGVDYYTQDLLRELVKQMPSSTFFLCYLSFFTKKPADLGIKASNVQIKRARFLPGKLYNFLERYVTAIPYDSVFRIKADVVFYPNFIRWPLVSIKKSVVVIHDLAFLDYPSVIIARHRKYLTKFVPKSISAATHIVTISENTKQRIIHHYKTDENKISVVTPAVDHSVFRPVAQPIVNVVKAKYKIEGEYLLFLGTIEPRKNIEGLLRAYAKLDESTRAKYHMVLAGGKGWYDEKINALIDSLGDQVVRTGYIDISDKPALYSGASLFVYPSHYEGWGMQPLEAMACGTPVITSNNSSLPEAAGDAGIQISSKDTQELTRQMAKVLADPKLAQAMVSKGFAHAKKFSWDKSARKLKEVFERL